MREYRVSLSVPHMREHKGFYKNPYIKSGKPLVLQMLADSNAHQLA